MRHHTSRCSLDSTRALKLTRQRGHPWSGLVFVGDTSCAGEGRLQLLRDRHDRPDRGHHSALARRMDAQSSANHSRLAKLVAESPKSADSHPSDKASHKARPRSGRRQGKPPIGDGGQTTRDQHVDHKPGETRSAEFHCSGFEAPRPLSLSPSHPLAILSAYASQ